LGLQNFSGTIDPTFRSLINRIFLLTDAFVEKYPRRANTAASVRLLINLILEQLLELLQMEDGNLRTAKKIPSDLRGCFDLCSSCCD
jgi:hypothetical protein